jgi:hypothetical protein
MTHVHDMGTRRDMSQRQSLIRVDDADRRNKVLSARRLIYESNYATNSTRIEAHLKDESLTPIMVGAN